MAESLRLLAQAVDSHAHREIYQEQVTHWRGSSLPVLGASEPSTVFDDANQWAPVADFAQQMMYLDQITYLPDDLLAKLDRGSMAFGLEARVPFLDHRVVTFAWSLPVVSKVNHKESKSLLRRLLYRYLPPELFQRPKMGFTLPLGEWLRGPLRDWGEALLHPERLRREGFFEPTAIERKWQDHVSGRYPYNQSLLWSILMFQSWLERRHG